MESSLFGTYFQCVPLGFHSLFTVDVDCGHVFLVPHHDIVSVSWGRERTRPDTNKYVGGIHPPIDYFVFLINVRGILQ